MNYERVVRELLKARACVEGVAKESDKAYRILARDLEVLIIRELASER